MGNTEVDGVELIARSCWHILTFSSPARPGGMPESSGFGFSGRRPFISQCSKLYLLISLLCQSAEAMTPKRRQMLLVYLTLEWPSFPLQKRMLTMNLASVNSPSEKQQSFTPGR